MTDALFKPIYRNVIRVPVGTRQRFLLLEQEASVPLTKIGVRLSGIGTFSSDYLVGYREPSCHLLLLTLAGKGFYRWDDQEYRPSAGELLVSPAGVPMLLGTIDKSWTFLWFYVLNLRRWQHLDGTPPQFVRPSFANQLRSGFEGLLAETGHAHSQSVLTESGWVTGKRRPIQPSSHAANLFGELLAEYLRQILSIQSSQPDHREQLLTELWRQVELSPGLDWSQEQICKQLRMSPATLQRLVRKYFDTSPQQMVIAIRMHHARRLLQQSDYPLSVIANEVGYADGFVLSAAFKKFHGQSPSFFRQAASDS